MKKSILAAVLLLSLITPPLSSSAQSASGNTQFSFTTVQSGITKNLNAVTFGGGDFVAVGDAGTVLKSASGVNGVSVQPVSFPQTNTNLISIGYGNDTFLAGGKGGAQPNLFYSTPTTAWKVLSGVNPSNFPAFTGGKVPVSGITYSGSRFAIVHDAPFAVSLVSPSDSVQSVPWTMGQNTGGIAIWYNQDGDDTQEGCGFKFHYGTQAGKLDITKVSTTGFETPVTVATISPGKMVSVGWLNAIRVSIDNGQTWKMSMHDSAGKGKLNGVAAGADKIVAVGSDGRVITSSALSAATWVWSEADKNYTLLDDIRNNCHYQWGVKWNTAAVGTNTLNAIIYTGSEFIAVGDNGKIITSPDGNTWTTISSGTTKKLLGVSYASTGPLAGTVLIVGEGGVVLAGKKGTQISTNTNTDTTTQALRAITYANGQFVAVGDNSTVMKSTTDGDKATFSKAESLSSGLNLRAVTYGNNKFVASGEGTKVVSSTNGQTWSANTSVFSADRAVSGIAFAGGVFAVAQDFLQVQTSPDLTTWTQRTMPEGVAFETYRAITKFGDTEFAIVGLGGAVRISKDKGATWTAVRKFSYTEPDLRGVAYGNNTLVAVAYQGKIAFSNDKGQSWTTLMGITTGTTQNLNAIAFGNKTFVAVGDAGVMLTSKDGATWTKEVSGTDKNLYGVAIATDGALNGTVAAVGDANVIVQKKLTASAANTATIKVTAPNGGEPISSVGNATTKVISNITWTTTNFGTQTVDIELLKQDGRVARVLATNIANSGTFAWTADATAYSPGSYKIRISSHDKKVQDTSDAFFTLSTPAAVVVVPPTITSISPTTGYVGQAVTLTGTFSPKENTVYASLAGKLYSVPISSQNTTSIQFTIPTWLADKGTVNFSVENGDLVMSKTSIAFTVVPSKNVINAPILIPLAADFTISGNGGNFTATPGQYFSLNWNSTSATSCSNNWNSSSVVNGSMMVTVNETKTFTLTCTNGATQVSRSITVMVAAAVANPPAPTGPVITSLSPSSGRAGDTITISGSNFSSSGNLVYIKTQSRTSTLHPTSESATSIQFVLPTWAIGPTQIAVENGNLEISQYTNITIIASTSKILSPINMASVWDAFAEW